MQSEQDRDPNSIIQGESRLSEVKQLNQGQTTTKWYNWVKNPDFAVIVVVVVGLSTGLVTSTTLYSFSSKKIVDALPNNWQWF